MAQGLGSIYAKSSAFVPAVSAAPRTLILNGLGLHGSGIQIVKEILISVCTATSRIKQFLPSPGDKFLR